MQVAGTRKADADVAVAVDIGIAGTCYRAFALVANKAVTVLHDLFYNIAGTSQVNLEHADLT